MALQTLRGVPARKQVGWMTNYNNRTAKKLQAGDKKRRGFGKRQAKTREKIDHFRQVMKLAPPAFDQLLAPVEPDEQQER